MKTVRQISKKHYLRQIVACWMVLSMLVVMPVRTTIADPPSGTLPDGFVLVSGTGSPSTTGNEMLIQNISNGAIFRWDGGFDIAEDAGVTFDFITSGSSVMNKDLTGSMSEIYGDLTALDNGNVWIINPAGIVIGPDATIDVTQLVASSLNIEDADFINGMPYTFTAGLTAGDVLNNADIEAEVIALVGKNVMNGGSLVADDVVIMAAGDTVRISDGTPIQVEVDMGIGDPENFVLRNEGGNGIAAKSLVLAAGDIFSAAYVSAYNDEAASDVVATVSIDAADDVEITGEVKAEAVGNDVDDAVATVTVKADGDVKVLAVEGDSRLSAEAYNGKNNTAKVRIDTIGGDVEVVAEYGGHAEITALASGSILKRAENGPEYGDVSNTADVTIYTNAVEVDGEIEGGNVEVTGESGGHALIEAKTMHGGTNDSDVLICADGYVIADSGSSSAAKCSPYFYGGSAKIQSIANYGDLNDAYLGIKAEGEFVKAVAVNGGYSAMRAEAKYGGTNNADVAICTDGAVYVIGDRGNAEIEAEALYGFESTANTAVCAVEDVLVLALSDVIDVKTSNPEGTGTAKIRAEAIASSPNKQIPVPGSDPSFATANTTVVSHEGSVAVVDMREYYGGRTAAIEAVAHGADYNTANVGVAAGKDLSPADVPTEFVLPQESPDDIEDIEGLLDEYPGSVGVYADGPGSLAQIYAHAYNGGENTADVVVCAPGIVGAVAEEGGVARIKSYANDGGSNKATTQVYASEVLVDSFGGSSEYIGAWAQGDKFVRVVPEFSWIAGEDDPYRENDGGSELIIDSHANRKDCPDCPPCPECEEEDEFVPPAPLVAFEIPRIEGCPVEMQAVAVELGIEQATIQVSIGNALALNPTLQPCQACATLINTAGILRDDDGSRMAAMNQVFNELAPADAPFTPETATSIAMAFEGAAEGTQYASVMAFIDAFVRYVAVLETQLGQPVDDSVAFVMEKYGSGLTDSDNANIAAYVAMRLEAIGG